MNQEDRHLIRLFYRSIPTPGEKEAFEAVMNGTENQGGPRYDLRRGIQAVAL
jgi:hypothetical protein